MQQIVVPCDFSQTAINAFRFAVQMASQTGGDICVLHVVELPVLVDGLVVPVVNFDAEFVRELKEKAESRYHSLVERYNPAGVSVQFCIEEGPVVATIRSYALEHHVDLIVMGSHGASGFRDLFIGSNAGKMVRKSPVPVLIIKDYVEGPVKNIVFPVALIDDEEGDFIERVKDLQRLFSAHIHIVWINTPLRFSADPDTFKRLSDFARRFRMENYSIAVFNHFNEEEGIIEFSGRIKGDLIAMGTHARRGISYLVNGSVAEDIVNHGKIPVWTCSLDMPAEKFDEAVRHKTSDYR